VIDSDHEFVFSAAIAASFNNCFESDGLPFRCAPGQAAAQAERYVHENKGTL
jgi:hypothetical protein